MTFHMYCYGDKHVHSHQIILLKYTRLLAL